MAASPVRKISAFPFSDSGNVLVVTAGVVSLPQYSAASTDVTGPGVPSSGMISPLMPTTSEPMICAAKLFWITHGAEPAVTP